MEKEIITMLKLQERCNELGAVLKFGNKVFTTWLDWTSFNAEIYEFVETEEETGKSYVECQLKKIAAATYFDDNGDAIKWCYDNMNSTAVGKE